MNSADLAAVLAIAETGNLTAAAARLHMSQPSLSRRLRALEDDLGVTLFDRVGRGLRLSGAGRALLPRVEAGLAAIDGVYAAAAQFAGAERGEFTVGVSAQLIEAMLAAFLPRFHARHPRIKVLLHEAGGAEMPHLVDNATVQLGVTAEPDTGAGFRIRRLGQRRIHVVAGRDSALAPRVELEALCAHPLLVLAPRFHTRRILDARFREAGLSPTIAVQCSSSHALVALAHAGLGVAVVPSGTRVDGPVSVLAQRGRDLTFPLAAVWDPRRPQPDYVGAFVDELARFIDETTDWVADGSGGNTAPQG